MSTADLFFGYLCGVVLLGAFVWIGIALRIAYTKMDLMLESLKNSSIVNAFSLLRQGGPWGKLLLVGSISGVVTFPAFYIRRGRASADDLSTFPERLKFHLVMLQWAGIAILSLGLLLFLVGKFIGWLK